MIHDSVPRPASTKRGNVILRQLYSPWCGAGVAEKESTNLPG